MALKQDKDKNSQCARTEQAILLSTPVVYGPVASRRLGRSLGINLFAPENKVCTFSCVYCQCGKARGKKSALPLGKIKTAITKSFDELVQLGTPVNYITFAGNGEPTIHPDFSEIVDFLLKARDKSLPQIPTAIFTNCTMLKHSEIQQAISKLDRRMLKLDASDQETMIKVNCNENFDDIVSGIIQISKMLPVEVSTAVIASPKKYANFASIKSQSYLNIIKEINPLGVYLYSIDRPPAESSIRQASRPQLLELADYLRKSVDFPVQVLRSRRTRPWSQWIWE